MAELVQALAWPAATVFLVVLLRRPLRQLMSRITKGKAAGVELEFGDGVQFAESKLDQAISELPRDVSPPREQPSARDDTPASESATERAVPRHPPNTPTGYRAPSTAPENLSDPNLRLLAEGESDRSIIQEMLSRLVDSRGVWADPSGLVIRSWELLSDDIAKLFRAVNLEEDRRRFVAPTGMIARLAIMGIVPESLAGAVRELSKLRNDVAHGRNQPSAGEAAAYEQSAANVRELLEVIRHQWEKGVG